VLTGKRGKAILGQFLSGKYLVYGCELGCSGRDGQEKWHMVEDAWDVPVKNALDDNGEYREVDRYGNEVVLIRPNRRNAVVESQGLTAME